MITWKGKNTLTNVFFIKIPFSATGNLGEVYDYKQFHVWKGKKWQLRHYRFWQEVVGFFLAINIMGHFLRKPLD